MWLQGGTFGFIHDILVTDQHYVILENPINMNFGKLLTKYTVAKACLAECLEYQQTKPTRVHVITRPGKQSSVLGKSCCTAVICLCKCSLLQGMKLIYWPSKGTLKVYLPCPALRCPALPCPALPCPACLRFRTCRQTSKQH